MLPLSQASPPSRWTAWAQVLAGHLVICNTFGYIGSWGFFESYYVQSLNATFSSISWVGSIQIFLVYFIGTFSGRALDAGYLRTTVAIGCVFQITGIFLTSIAKSYIALFVSQGILVGIGDGLVFCPMISLVSTYYTDRTRALAVSFAAAGAATGGIIFPLIAKFMLGPLGIAWTLRVMGLVFLVNSTVAVSVLRVRVQARKSGPLIEWRAFKEVPYLLFCVGAFSTLWGLYFAYYYVSIFGKTIIHVPAEQAFYLIMAINGIGVFGRILPAWLVTRCGDVLNVLVPITFIAGFMLYFWSLVTTKVELVAWIIFYGFFANAVASLFVGGVGSLTKDKQKMGVRIGMVFTIVSFACLTGPPIAGALIDGRDGDFLYAQLFGGTVMVSGAVALLGAMLARRFAAE
ncbi:hypothetical protein OIDMADRAFT_131291 [Oidiodendron maius Zn]|uniref:Major facilitator superfamily (MFS) profile domain-containing protein n=1 Tax=Oidiodendron maius (strain Zn) TaxID=913774 RepID=A0A0C3H2E4_OIDMZ|nr:hypothetical protein OIDMADRAFT_131291 [Oidiodendron maius Zn]